ncbi:hypothetical protein [Kitasatospora paranensis]|uniref:hypothetical protein n=1 Tax=Kitasatospora paranensis TaxID=258053 RepID=UPI0031EDC902
MAELDEARSYRVSADPSYQQKFTFVKQTEGADKGEWRIDRLPDGLIVDQTNFKNAYRAVHRYFFASSDPSAEGAAAAAAVMVPDPIYLRRRTDPLTAAAKALVAGPSRWLAPAVHTAFDGVRIEGASPSATAAWPPSGSTCRTLPGGRPPAPRWRRSSTTPSPTSRPRASWTGSTWRGSGAAAR